MNPVEVGIETREAPILGVAGALWFAMTLELVDGGSSIQGSISVQGSSGSGGPGIGSFYSAEFTGTRIGE